MWHLLEEREGRLANRQEECACCEQQNMIWCRGQKRADRLTEKPALDVCHGPGKVPRMEEGWSRGAVAQSLREWGHCLWAQPVRMAGQIGSHRLSTLWAKFFSREWGPPLGSGGGRPSPLETEPWSCLRLRGQGGLTTVI